MACLSVLPPIFCNTHIRPAGSRLPIFPVSVVSFFFCFSLRFPIGLCSLHWSQGFCTVSIFVHLAIVSLLPLFYLPFPCSVWHALSLASSFPIRLATSLCLSAVSPCPSFPRLYKRPISALLRLPPCPAFFCSPILVPSTLFRFATFAEHCHTAAYPRSPAVLFLSSCPAAFALFIGRRVPAYFKLCPPCCCYLPLLPFPALCFYCFVLARAFPLYSLLIPPFKALFFLVFALVSLCRFTFALSFNARFLLHFSQKSTSLLATLTAVPFLPSSSSISYRFYQILPALLPASPAFLIFDVRSISTCFYKPLFPGIPAKIPLRASFLRTKKPAHSPVFSL